MNVQNKPRKKSRRLEQRAKAIDEIRDLYNKSDEAKRLEDLTSNELIEMYKKDREWLRYPCGYLDIDAKILARSSLVGKILANRRVTFSGGEFQGPVLP